MHNFKYFLIYFLLRFISDIYDLELCYFWYILYKTILLVDTPGLYAPEGIEIDDNYIDSIIDSAIKIQKINVILVLEKFSTNRLVPTVKYYLCRLCEVIPNAFENKIILGLSFKLNGDSGFNNEWFPFACQLKVKMNNICFAYSNKTYITKPKKAELIKMSFKHSRKVINAIINKVIEMDSQETSIYSELFKDHNKIMKNISNFTIILENIDRIHTSMTNSSFEINNENVLTWKRTKKHNTICVEHHTLCHKNCDLNFTSADGSKYFENCFCMIHFCICLDSKNCRYNSGERTCRICGCGSAQHVHRHKKLVRNQLTIEKILSDLKISNTSKDPSMILMMLNEKKRRNP